VDDGVGEAEVPDESDGPDESDSDGLAEADGLTDGDGALGDGDALADPDGLREPDAFFGLFEGCCTMARYRPAAFPVPGLGPRPCLKPGAALARPVEPAPAATVAEPTGEADHMLLRESPAIARARAEPTAMAAASRPTAIRRRTVARPGETWTGLVRENDSGGLTALRWSASILAAATPATGQPSGTVHAMGRLSGTVRATSRPSEAVLATAAFSTAAFGTGKAGSAGEASFRSADCGKPAQSSGGTRDAASTRCAASRSSAKQASMPARVPGGRVGHGSRA
jgi:hypothetical protein